MLATLKFKSEVATGVLDNGADSIFLDEDRFKNFMESIADLTDDMAQPAEAFDKEEKGEIGAEGTEELTNEVQELPGMLHEETNSTQSAPATEMKQAVAESPASSLINNGMNFFSQLVNTLSNEQAVKELAQSITEKDEKTGKTYLKLPVDNEGTIEKALNLLGGLLKGFGK
jgi:hypothetical protein